MKQENLEQLTKFNSDNKEFDPIKVILTEEFENVIGEVSSYNAGIALRLEFLANIVIDHLHSDIMPLKNKDISALDRNFYGLYNRIEKAKLLLLQQGYKEEVTSKNPVWFLDMALSDMERIKEEVKAWYTKKSIYQYGDS